MSAARAPAPGGPTLSILKLHRAPVLFLDDVRDEPGGAGEVAASAARREFQRLGGTRNLKANILVIAATNRDLGKALWLQKCGLEKPAGW